MTHNIYDARAVKEKVNCGRYLEDQGYEVTNGNRFVAKWRGGKNPSCSFKGPLWFDHKAEKGGSVIDLAMIIEGFTNPLSAIQALGNRYDVTPVATTREATRKTHAESLIEAGYKLKATYEYQDENARTVFYVDRYEKPKTLLKVGEKPKVFDQRTDKGEGRGDTPNLLYNLPAVIKSHTVYVVEGEKDVETLRGINIVATCNPGGAGKWDETFNKFFEGKRVIILADNDEKGQHHAELVLSMVRPFAKSVKVITISKLQKGDVTDWMEREGGTREKLEEAVAKAEYETKVDPPDVAAAKAANLKPFTNFATHIEGRKKIFSPLLIEDIMVELKKRFLGYPRLIGSTPFDWSRDGGEIVKLNNKNDLFAWIQGCSRQPVMWEKGPGYVSREELFSRILQTATRYAGVSSAPHFPPRKDVFYTHGEIPASDPTHSTFWGLMDFFNPSNAANRTLLAAFFCAPSFYDGRNSRPAWVIDTDDAQASGKSTIVKMCARLYCEDPIDMDLKSIEWDSVQFTKRILSAEGRGKRIVLIDNVTGSIKGGVIAKLVTAPSISGMAPYGHGEETRPNDLTYACTVNGANMDTDMATRAYTIRIRAPKDYDPGWENRVMDYIEKNRMRIFSDIRDMMDHAVQRKRRRSRFGMFDQRVLSAVCASDEEFQEADKALSNEAKKANEDGELATACEEAIMSALLKYPPDKTGGLDTDYPLFVRASDVDRIFNRFSGDVHKTKSKSLRNFIKIGLLPRWSKVMERSPRADGFPQTRGFVFGVDRMYEVNPGHEYEMGYTWVQLVSFDDHFCPHRICDAKVDVKRV